MKFFVICVLSVGLLMSLSPVHGGPADTGDNSECYKMMKACCENSGDCENSCSSKLDKTHSYEDFIKLANDNLIRSWEYLFLSAQFGTHVKQRLGFEKILHGLADEGWNKGFEMIKEASKRGFTHKFGPSNEESNLIKTVGDVAELPALAKAVDIEKNLLNRANNVHLNHQHAAHKNDASKYGTYDASLAHYLEEEIIEKKTENIRHLVGHVNDLKNIFSKGEEIYSMSLYLFDQYLQK